MLTLCDNTKTSSLALTADTMSCEEACNCYTDCHNAPQVC